MRFPCAGGHEREGRVLSRCSTCALVSRLGSTHPNNSYCIFYSFFRCPHGRIFRSSIFRICDSVGLITPSSKSGLPLWTKVATAVGHRHCRCWANQLYPAFLARSGNLGRGCKNGSLISRMRIWYADLGRPRDFVKCNLSLQ